MALAPVGTTVRHKELGVTFTKHDDFRWQHENEDEPRDLGSEGGAYIRALIDLEALADGQVDPDYAAEYEVTVPRFLEEESK